MPESAGTCAGGSGGDGVGTLHQDDVLDAGCGQVIGGAGTDHPAADDHHVRRAVHGETSTAARAITRSSNAIPTDLKIVMSDGERRTCLPRTAS